MSCPQCDDIPNAGIAIPYRLGTPNILIGACLTHRAEALFRLNAYEPLLALLAQAQAQAALEAVCNEADATKEGEPRHDPRCRVCKAVKEGRDALAAIKAAGLEA